MKKKTLIIDPNLCTGCEACVYVCATRHWGTPARIRLIADEAEGRFLPINCVGCPDRPCTLVCPEKAVWHSRRLNLPLIRIDKCTGCGLCVKVCPLNVIFLNRRKKKAYKCDLCAGKPACAEACIPKAIRYEYLNQNTARDKICYLANTLET
jgi:Fe-S-cluster-containing hydrogenase component 2